MRAIIGVWLGICGGTLALGVALVGYLFLWAWLIQAMQAVGRMTGAVTWLDLEVWGDIGTVLAAFVLVLFVLLAVSGDVWLIERQSRRRGY